MSTMKQFGLEFIVRDNATKTLRNLNRELETLERTMQSIIPVASKFEKTMGNLNVTKAVNQINRLNGAMRNYNTTLKQVAKNNGFIPKSTGTNSNNNSSTLKDWMGADYLRDATGQIAGSLGSAFNNMPFGNIIGSAFSSSMEGIATSVFTGNIIPALTGLLSAGVDTAVGVYNTSSQLVHNAIYSAFDKGTQLISGVLTKYLPQTLTREYDIEKLSAVLGDDTLAKSLNRLGVEYAKSSSLSLADMDFILPNLTMANKATGVQNSEMYSILQKQMDAVVRLNFKDSGQGAGVKGSLVALQEMLSGDYISLKRRFEMTGASIDRIKEAEAKGGVMSQMEQLIKELESMGVTDQAIKQMSGTAKYKFERISESITDILTNPSTGIFASVLEGMKPILDNVDNFFETGGYKITGFNVETGMRESITQLDLIISNVNLVLGKLGEFGLKLGEGFINGFVATVNWSGLSEAIVSLMDTISTYFEPTFTRLGEWVNTSFIPWLGNMNSLLQDETVRQGILDYIDSLGEIMDNSLDLITKVTESMPTIAKVTTSMSNFVDTCKTMVIDVMNNIANLPQVLSPKNYAVANGGTNTAHNGASTTQEQMYLDSLKKQGKLVPKKAIGSPFIPTDNYPALLHRGERVLTAQQNKQFNKQQATGINVSKIADTVVIREEADIQKIARAFVKELNESTLTYGGVY